MAKAQGDRAQRPAGERWAVPNEARGSAPRVDRLQARPPTLSVLEAPGGLERAAPAAWAAAGRPVVVVTPRHAREVARATGPLAKTEAWEARALAPWADGIRPTPRPLPDAQTQALRALLGRRQPRMGMRTAAQHRLAGPSGRLQTAMAAQSPWRKARLATRDDARETTRRASPLWREHDERLPSAPGLGPVGARTLRRALPAWGPRTRQQLAAWGGVAPLHGDRGTLRGRRPMWGGRAHGRTVCAMGTRVATRDHPRINAFDARLLAAGKGKQVALTACIPQFLTMRKALLKHRTP